MFYKVFLLINQLHLNNILFVIIGILDKGLMFQLSVCNGCHAVLIMSIDINSIAVLNFYGVD